jgi:hypothetical protein
VSEFLEKLDQGNFTGVDLSDNNLLDDSLKQILDKLSTLDTIKLVDLSGNRFTPNMLPLVAEYLHKHPEVEFFNVIGSPMGTIDSADQFEEVAKTTPDIFARLIWIPLDLLSARKWMHVLGKNAIKHAQVIEDAHARWRKALRSFVSWQRISA